MSYKLNYESNLQFHKKVLLKIKEYVSQTADCILGNNNKNDMYNINVDIDHDLQIICHILKHPELHNQPKDIDKLLCRADNYMKCIDNIIEKEMF